ncbi:MAG: glycosyltransferase family A protein [Nanopusillaceae archaeon]
MKDILASVVLVDYKRKIFIKDAIASILNQKGIDPKNIELIVVKNYEDKEIDNYIKNNFIHNKIINLQENNETRRIGYKLGIGIENTSSNIIFLLEDDDMFTENKIARILDISKSIKLKNYAIHNAKIYINENKEIIYKESKKEFKKEDGNVSSYTLVVDNETKKELSNMIKNIDIKADLFLYLYFKYKRAYIKLFEHLTKFRIHQFNTSVDFNIDIVKRSLKDLEYMEKYYKNNKIFKISMFSTKIILNLFDNGNYKIEYSFDMRFKELIKYLMYKFMRNKLKEYYKKRYKNLL